jgi:hypothetical protein
VVHGHTLWDTDELIKKAGGKAPDTMKSFTALTHKAGKPAAPRDAPAKLPSVDKSKLQAVKKFLCKGTGEVPSLGDLGLDLPGGQATPFRVRSASCLLHAAWCAQCFTAGDAMVCDATARSFRFSGSWPWTIKARTSERKHNPVQHATA